MTKKTISVMKKTFSLYGFLDGESIGDVIEILNTLIAEGFNLEDKFDVDCYDGYADISLEHFRIETDEEYAARLLQEETDQQLKLERKKREYEQLKKELGYD